MDQKSFSTPLSLRSVKVTDSFWKKEMELVRTEVIPYQWAALNDAVEGAAPSFCMHNFKAAGKLNLEKKKLGNSFQEPTYTFRGFESLPKDPEHLEDKFYGFVFQDSDFYKWIEAVGYSLTQHPDKELETLADNAIDIVCAAQQADGYLDTYYILNGKDRIFTDLRDHHELYCLGHLLEGAVAYYQATGKDKLLRTACRFADYVADHFGAEEGKCKGYPGHEIAEMALIRLYELTEDQKYLNLARFFVDERGARPYYYDREHPEDIKNGPEDLRYEYNQAHLPVREQDEAVGHAVRAVYLYSGMADVARLTGDEKLFHACEALWDNMTQKKMYITGGIGGTHIGEAFSFNYDLPNDTAYAETCASIGLIFFARRMLEIEANAKYADAMELALYNTVLSGMALDGKSFFYVNPLEVNPEACHKDERKEHVKPVRQKWFGCACCPPNIARTISAISSYAFTEQADALFVHLYMGCEITRIINGQELTIRIASGFPWNGRVQISVSGSTAPFTLALRLPGWCRKPTLTMGNTVFSCNDPENDKLQEQGSLAGGTDTETGKTCVLRKKNGYLYITKTWLENECLTLDFPMEAVLLEADPRVREDLGKVALVRGPLVYCLEEQDNGKNLHLLSVELDAALEACAAINSKTTAETGDILIPADSEINDKPDSKDTDISFETAAGLRSSFICNEPIREILLPGFRQKLPECNGRLYFRAAKPEKTPVILHFIPYYTWANRGENEMTVWVRRG